MKNILKIGTVALINLGVLLVICGAFKFIPAAFFNETDDQYSLVKIEEPASLENAQTDQQISPQEINQQMEFAGDGIETEAEVEVDTKRAIPIYQKRPDLGEEFGLIEIPAINKSFPIFHGTDDEHLDHGVGHYRGSVLPGEPDHSILSAHRDTYFRELGDVVLNDTIIVTTAAGTFTYKVVDIYIVDAEDDTVIKPTDGPTLSLTTCYPFEFIGKAPERYIVHAKMVK